MKEIFYIIYYFPDVIYIDINIYSVLSHIFQNLLAWMKLFLHQ